MVRIALIGAALVAAVMAAPAMPIEGAPSQISDHVPHATGAPVAPFPDATKTKYHHYTPSPTPTPGAHHHEGGHHTKLPTHILPRWLMPRAEGEQTPEASGKAAKHNPEFPTGTGEKHHHTPTPTPHHHHTPTPGAHQGKPTGSFALPMPTGVPMLPGKQSPSGIKHAEPLEGPKTAH